MQKNNIKLKKFIKKYNIANPDWSNIPKGFPWIEVTNLTLQEKIIWESAVMAWINEHPLEYFGKQITYSLLTTTSFAIFVLIFTMFLYYVDVNYHWGLKFLTDFFA